MKLSSAGSSSRISIFPLIELPLKSDYSSLKPSIFNKNHLNEELDNFFRLIKLKTYFKEKNVYKQTTRTTETNKKWRPDKNHYTVETYIEATKNTLETEE